MKLVPFLFVVASLVPVSARPQQAAAPPMDFSLAASLVRGHESAQRNLVEAAEAMPEEHYSFRATPETKPFGQIVAHIAFSRFGSCAALRGVANPKQGQQEAEARTKAQAVALLKEAGAYCSEPFAALTDANVTEKIEAGPKKVRVARGVFVAGENSHANEIYGTMAVYLRLKGIVPPTTARMQQQRKTQ